MKVIIVKTVEEMGRRTAQLIADEMKRHATPVLGLATGSTPIPVYKELIRMHKEEGLDFSTTITFNLDEYVGLSPDHDQSYRYFMNKNLFDHININKRDTHVPDGLAKDVEKFCCEYETMISDVSGIDLQLLGIGANGHIGFSEPGSSLASLTQMTILTQRTIEDNARFFKRKEDVPTKAITMGIGTILNAKKVVLVANGANKADAIAKSAEGPITSMVPASALQLHRFATFVITEDAASKLTLRYEDK
ncbi:MAG: glucosamine-6-phosphate deaminase [Candidatus Omnitrophota bacterium]